MAVVILEKWVRAQILTPGTWTQNYDSPGLGLEFGKIKLSIFTQKAAIPLPPFIGPYTGREAFLWHQEKQ